MPIHTLSELEYSVEWNGDVPRDGDDNFWRIANFYIGPRGDRGADHFELEVCSPNRLLDVFDPAKWTEDEMSDPFVLPGGNVAPVRGLWLMKVWSLSEFTEKVERFLHACLPAPDFPTFAYRVGLFIPWEYDYRFEREQNRRAGLPDTHDSFLGEEWPPQAD